MLLAKQGSQWTKLSHLWIQNYEKWPTRNPWPEINSLSMEEHRNYGTRTGKLDLSTKVETAFMRKYFDDKCNTVKQTGRTNKFGDTIKPFVTNKVKYYGDVISLKVNDSIVNDPLLVCSITETEMSSFWRNLHHWLHRKLSKWQLSVQQVMKISSKWLHFRFSDI